MTLSPMTERRSQFDDLLDRGFAEFTGLLTPHAVEELRKTIGEFKTSDEFEIGGRQILERHPDVILPLICSPAILDLAERIIGPFVQLDSFSFVRVSANSNADVSWHRDVFGSVPSGFGFEKPLALNLLVYLQDLTPECGPLRTIAGSHRESFTMTHAERNQSHPRETLLFPTAGSGVLLHNNLVHSRSRNQSPRDRIHLSIIYTWSFMKSSINLDAPPLSVLREEARRVREVRLMRLLGEDIHADKRYNSGFLRPDEEMRREWLAADRATVSKG